MTPLDNFSTIFDGRESVLTTLFGQQVQINGTEEADKDAKLAGKKRKNREKANAMEDEDDIRLL